MPNQDTIHQYEPLMGSWYVEEEIGEGSFGVVYKVHKEELGRHLVSAVKLISIPDKAQYKDAESRMGDDIPTLKQYFLPVVQNIMREIEVLNSMVGNSNVLAYHDCQVNEKKDGVGWDVLIRMEYIKPLKKYLKEHAMTQQDVIRMGIDICRALEVCSKKGLIHRDIKDDNIFVNDDGVFKLGDFGIAKELTKITTHGTKIGTICYMAPEVYAGRKYDALVDIYSLGIVMYRLLNDLRLPFVPPYPQIMNALDDQEAQDRRLSGEAMPKPSKASDVLAELVLMACAYKPEDRFQSAYEMRVALEEVFNGKQTFTGEVKKTVVVVASSPETVVLNKDVSFDNDANLIVIKNSNKDMNPINDTNDTKEDNDANPIKDTDPNKDNSLVENTNIDETKVGTVRLWEQGSTPEDTSEYPGTVNIYSTPEVLGNPDVEYSIPDTDNVLNIPNIGVNHNNKQKKKDKHNINVIGYFVPSKIYKFILVEANHKANSNRYTVGKKNNNSRVYINGHSTIKEYFYSGKSNRNTRRSTIEGSFAEPPTNTKPITPTKMRVRIWSLVIWFVLLLLIWIAYRIYVPSLHPTMPNQIKVGDYLNFGRYYGRPIIWKCVDKNNEELILISEYILCQKAFDAAESGTWGQGSDDVQKYGSNVWANSNMREWLNSTDQSVAFTTQIPTKYAVWDGKNAYADEPGFLSNFTQDECDAIIAVTHDGVTDKVFLPSEEEVNQYYGSSNSQRKRTITAIGKQNGDYKADTDGNYWHYWTRSPEPSNSRIVRYVSNNGAFFSYDFACLSSIGVAPVLHISSYIPVRGAGSINKPWFY